MRATVVLLQRLQRLRHRTDVWKSQLCLRS